MNKNIVYLCFVLLFVFATAETNTLFWKKWWRKARFYRRPPVKSKPVYHPKPAIYSQPHPYFNPHLHPFFHQHAQAIAMIKKKHALLKKQPTLKPYGKKRCAKDFRIWFVRNTPKGKDGRRPQPTTKTIAQFWSKKKLKGYVAPNYQKCLEQYQKDRRRALRKYLFNISNFMRWFLRRHKPFEHPKVSDAEEWWGRRSHVAHKPNFVKFCAKTDKKIQNKQKKKKLSKFKIWWKAHKKIPDSKPTVADMKAWWNQTHTKPTATKPDFENLYLTYGKSKEEYLILKDFGSWWSRYGRRSTKTKKLKSPTAKDISQWWYLDANRKNKKANFKHLARQYKRQQRKKRALNRKVNRKFDRWWRKQGKSGEPTLADVKLWYSSYKPGAKSQPDFNKLLVKILKFRGKRRNNKYLRAFKRYWIKSGPKGKNGKRLEPTIYDLKAWWTSYSMKRKNLVPPSFEYLFKLLQAKTSKKQEKKKMTMFWKWWLQYKFQKKSKGVQVSKTPKRSYIKWWFGKYHFALPRIGKWLKKLKKNLKKSKAKKEKKGNCKNFTIWWKKQGNGKRPSIFDIKAWYLRRKASKPGLKRPNFAKLLRSVKRKVRSSKFFKGFKAWWKGLGKKGKKPSRKSMVQYWKEIAKPGQKRPIFTKFLLKLKKKIIKKRYQKYLSLFRKWWKKYNNLRNVKVANPTLAHFKLWWTTQMKKVKKSKTPNFTKLYSLYYKRKSDNKIKLAFKKYWNTVANRLPKLSDLKAWWARSRAKFTIRKPNLNFIKKYLIAKEHAKNFKKWWKSTTRLSLPTAGDLKIYIEEMKKKVKGFTMRNFALVMSYIKRLFSHEQLPARILRTYPELKFVHKQLIEMAKRKGLKLKHVNDHLEAIRKAYLKAGSDLKVAEHAKRNTKEQISKFEMLFKQKRNQKELIEKEYKQAQIVSNSAWMKYKKARSEFEIKKNQYLKETQMRTKEFFDLTEKLKGIRILISLVGPQHSVRVRRECQVHKFGHCSQQFCCNVKYLSTVKGEKKIGNEYCLLQGTAKCNFPLK